MQIGPFIEKHQKIVSGSVVYLLFLICAYPAWVRGGVVLSLYWPVVLFTLLLMAASLFLPEPERGLLLEKVRKDPILLAGGFLLLLILIQCINGGHGTGEGLEAVRLHHPNGWLPFVFRRMDAWAMLLLFFPACVAILTVRHRLSRRQLKRLLNLLVWNAALLALVGVVQEWLDVEKIMGVWRRTRYDFFATFDYPNHAAAWFYLHAGLAAGLACDSEVKRKPRLRSAVFGICFLCCMAASVLSLSRYGALITMLQMAGLLGFMAVYALRLPRGAGSLNTYLFLVIILFTTVALFLGAGRGRLVREFSEKPMFGEQSLLHDLTARQPYTRAATAMWATSPVFGCGSGGCDWLLNDYVEPYQARSWIVNGRASVHCDPIQFLVEYGIVGAACLAVITIVLLGGAVRARRSFLWLWIFSGVVAVWIHGLIDLPFRSPAILISWSVLMAAIPRLSRKGKAGKGNKTGEKGPSAVRGGAESHGASIRR